MNPEALLHEAAELLHAEAIKGPGTMFLLLRAGKPAVTRIGPEVAVNEVVARYDCGKFCEGLTAKQWAAMLLGISFVYNEQQKGDASAKNNQNINASGNHAVTQ